ncbi:MAG TPA: hypothetical protein VNW47_00865 [Terriglobales bacterium]|nr:hypothetical protein [Terriglobales bacterium]
MQSPTAMASDLCLVPASDPARLSIVTQPASFLSVPFRGLLTAFRRRLVSYGALPLLTVLASQFPGIGRFLFPWVQPAIESLH